MNAFRVDRGAMGKSQSQAEEEPLNPQTDKNRAWVPT